MISELERLAYPGLVPSEEQRVRDLRRIGMAADLFRHRPSYPWEERCAHQHFSYAEIYARKYVFREVMKDLGHRFGLSGCVPSLIRLQPFQHQHGAGHPAVRLGMKRRDCFLIKARNR